MAGDGGESGSAGEEGSAAPEPLRITLQEAVLRLADAAVAKACS